MNSQVEKTPIVIVTLGHDRLLHWRRSLEQAYKKRN